ncbi:unnamed protein product [Cunninghamella blakesleeana]
MDQLPIEILQSIFSLLSTRYRATCMVVCKKWNLALYDISFYKVIKINTYIQLRRFIEAATTVKVNKVLIGNHVQTLLLQDIYKAAPYRLSLEDIEQLHLACPNVKWINEIISPHLNITYSQPYWKYLTTITSWVTRYDDDWYWRLDQKENIPLVSFELNVMDCIQRRQNSLLYFEKDQQVRKRERLDRPIFVGQLPFNNDQNSNNNNDSNNIEVKGEMIDYFGKVLSFSAVWQSLNYLILDFSSGNNFSYSSSPNVSDYELDERTIDSIFQACPVLEHLSIDYFFMNISDQYHQDLKKDHITPSTSLKVLQFNHCMFHEVECFYYFLKKCPSVTTLILYLQCYIHLDEIKKSLFRKGIYDMITRLKYLKHLSTRLEYASDYYMCPVEYQDNFFPDTELKNWLTCIQPSQLESLDYIYDLSLTSDFIEDKEFNDQQKHCHSYLNHLKTFTLESQNGPSVILNNYFLRNNTTDYGSYSITTLNMSFTINPMSVFNIFDWLDAFPNLNNLHISKAAICNKMNKPLSPSSAVISRSNYKLRKLIINNSKFYYVSKGMNTLFKRCPFINVLELNTVDFINHSLREDDTNDNDSSSIFTINASQLMLDKLYIQYIHLGSTQSPENRITEFILHESESNGNFNYVKPTLLDVPLKLKFKCQSVDEINFT